MDLSIRIYRPKNILFRLLEHFITVSLCILSAQTAYATDDQRVVLKSASELDYPPFALVKPDGSADGFSVDLLEAVVKIMNRELKIKVAPWNEIKQELKNGDLDILPLVAYSSDRDKYFDFTVPYLYMHGDIFVRKDEKAIQSKNDLHGKKILVMRGDTAHEWAIKENLSADLILTDSFEKAFSMLSRGKYDAVIAQHLVGLQLIKKLGITNVVTVNSSEHELNTKPAKASHAIFEQKFCIAVKEGDSRLLAHLNEGLAIVVANGTYDELYKKWFAPVLPPYPISIKLLAKYLTLILVPALLIMMISWLWYFKRELTRKTQGLRQEIKRRQQVEENLRFHAKITANMAEGISLVRADDGIIVYTNPKFDQMFGYIEGELIGQHVSVINAQTDKTPEETAEGIMRILNETGEWHGEVENIKKDGTPFWCNASVSGFDHMEYGEVWVAIHTDITQRKQVEKLLLQSKQDWENTFDSMSDVVTLQDKDMRIVRANAAAHQLFKVSPGDLNGKYCFEIFQAGKHPCPGCPELKTIKDGCSHTEIIKYELLEKIFSVSSSPVFDKDGEIRYLVHVAKDISEKKKLEEELFQAHKMEAIGTLAGGIAHDFNNVLTAILGFAEMAKNNIPEDNRSKDYINRVLSAGVRARELVRQILTFSRKNPQQLRLFEPHLVVKEALKLMRSTLPTTITIKEEIDSECGPILADPTQVHQVLLNLCTNAFQAMENEKGELQVKLSRKIFGSDDITEGQGVTPGQFVELTVRDTGTGIDRITMERMFEPYFTTKEAGKGTGMGLAVVHGIVQSCGGQIKVESSLGKGTTIHVYFPAMLEEGIQHEEEKPLPLPGNGEHVLMIDDEYSIVDYKKTALESFGYKVTGKTSSEDALNEFMASPDDFDLVITDQTMPAMTGAELARELLKISPNIPIILCTGYSNLINEIKAQKIGIKEFILKPIGVKDLVTLVRKVLDENEPAKLDN